MGQWSSADAFWNDVLGVDVADVDAFLGRFDDVKAWLARLSASFLYYVMTGAVDTTSTQRPSRDVMIDALMAGPPERLRQLSLAERLLRGKRKDAIHTVTERLASLHRHRWSSLSDDERALAFVYEKARHDLQPLLQYVLEDRLVRVKLHPFLTEPVEKAGEPGLHGTSRLGWWARIVQSVAAMPDDDLRRVLNGLWGSSHDSDGVRLDGRLIDGPDVTKCTVFVTRRGKRETVRTFEGFVHVTKGELVIMQFRSEQPVLSLSPGTTDVVRGAEAMATTAVGSSVTYSPAV